jgi:DNA processing protein
VSSYRRLPRSHPAYPPLLAAVHGPPARLWLRGRGDPELLSRPAVAVVGARACSAYGEQVARLVGRELASAGVVVVSGLARGVDGEAHRGALEAGGTTVAVLGCGIDRDYPARHARLAAQIAETGLVISEYEPGIDPAPWRFPARNRIVAGLAAAVVIVEARERSGALITADFALEEGREVFAVPGEITSRLSVGTNELIRLGAAPLTKTTDVLEALGIEAPGPSATPSAALTPAAERVLAVVRDAPLGLDEIARSSGIDAGSVAAAVSELELAGLVTDAAGVFRAAGAHGGS